jgi:hypothetical protein
MKIYTTSPLEHWKESRRILRELEEIGYDGGLSFEHWTDTVAQPKEKHVTA